MFHGTLLGLTLICFMLVSVHYSGAQTGTCGRKDKVQMTVMSFKSKDAGNFSTLPLPHFECYLGAGDGDATVTSIRAYNTRNNGHPVPIVSGTMIPDLPRNTAGYSVSITSANSNAFGVFSCIAKKADREDTTIMTIFQHADAYVVPVNRQFTQTVNAGETGVVIDMDWPGIPRYSWRINGSRVVATTENITIDREAATDDNGLYECHIGYRRDDALHGLNRLIVRACSSGRWGPPGCTGTCDNCYNGGVCDDETGKCICAPGFMGQNCLTGCGPDKFGYSCEFECSIGNGAADDGCRGRLFCLIDPFGCRCNSGFKDLNCSVVCEPGKFGAGCLQDCHCQNQGSCNRFTGECETGGCQAAWSGNNCQIPDVCPMGYYGNQCTEKCLCLGDAACDKDSGQCEDNNCAPGSMLDPNSQSCLECQAGFFGDNCREECRCDSDACDRVTGECVGCCKHHAWIDTPPSRCQEEIINVTVNKTNPGTQWSVICWVEEIQVSSPKYTVFLSQSMDNSSTLLQTTSNFTETSNRTGFVQRGSLFTTTDAQAGDTYYCVIPHSTGFAWLSTTLSQYDLPIISESPEIVDMSQTSVTIQWRAWDEQTDVGDPPVVGYIVYYRKDATDRWINVTIIESSQLLQYTQTSLEKDTIYAFSVSAVREGDMGEGRMGPPMTVKTLCSVQSTPTAVMATVTDLNQLNVTWQVVDNDITCSTGITGYTIYYKVDGSSDDPQRVTTVSGSTMFTIIKGLEPGENYTFMVSLTTDQESPLSEASMAVTFPMSSTPKPQEDDDNSIAVFIVIPAVFAIALLIIIITFVLIYRKRSRKASPSPSDPTSFTNNVAIGMEEQDLPTEVKDKTEYIPLDKNKMLKSPDQYQNLNQPVSGDQAEGYEVPRDKISSLVESGSTYEAVGSTVVSKASIERELKQDNDYEDPVDIEQYAGVYINVDTAKKTAPPKPIKVSELQDYMSRDRRNVIEDVVKEFMVLPVGRQHPCSEAIQHERLKSKNSLSKIIPYDHTRVKLQVSGNTGESDYYNASMIKAQQGKARFITAIGPQSKGLAEQFWRMIWQQDVRTLVMLDEDVYSYWPSKVKTTEVFGEMTVLLQEATNHQTYTNRKLKIITADDKILNVHQLQFHIWPQGGVPGDCADLIDFIKQVKTRQEQTKLSPMLIHCRDGSGSTGTFLALYQLLDVLRYSSTISIYNVIRNMREHRMDMVLTRVQYLYIYDTLQHAQLTPEKTKTFSKEFNGMDDQTMKRKAVHEFAALRKIQELNMPQQQQIGEAEENVYKNRFPGIIPFDSSRPVLKSNSVTHGSNDYVNATKLEDDGSIILTQDPMAATLEDFWRIVYDYKCSTIIMLKDMSTANKTAAKYWPDSGMITYGFITVKCLNTESQDLFRTQKFQVMHQDHQEPVIVNHLTFEAFLGDDEDLPRMLDFIQSTGNVTSGPTVIHCLNGVGFSAVYVTVKAQIQRLEKEGACDVCLAVQQLRRKNVKFMLSQDNYILCLKLLRCYLNNQDDYSVIY